MKRVDVVRAVERIISPRFEDGFDILVGFCVLDFGLWQVWEVGRWGDDVVFRFLL